MAHRTTLCAAALLAGLSFSAGAVAAKASIGSVSGPASGTDIIPSTAFQKEMMEGRSVSGPVGKKTGDLMSALISVGGPGIEGLPGTQSGPEHGAKPVQERAELMAALVSVGAPGMEGLPDTQSGR